MSEVLYCDINCVVCISVYLKCFEHIRIDQWNYYSRAYFIVLEHSFYLLFLLFQMFEKVIIKCSI